MAWKVRNKKPYYYKTIYINGKYFDLYLGGGERGAAAERMFEARRARRHPADGPRVGSERRQTGQIARSIAALGSLAPSWSGRDEGRQRVRATLARRGYSKPGSPPSPDDGPPAALADDPPAGPPDSPRPKRRRPRAE